MRKGRQNPKDTRRVGYACLLGKLKTHGASLRFVVHSMDTWLGACLPSTRHCARAVRWDGPYHLIRELIQVQRNSHKIKRDNFPEETWEEL